MFDSRLFRGKYNYLFSEISESDELLSLIEEMSSSKNESGKSSKNWSLRRDRQTHVWTTHRQMIMTENILIKGEQLPDICQTAGCMEPATMRY